MILGFSHLTLRCAELNAAIGELGNFGYKSDFIQTNLQNPKGKQPFSTRWCDSMNMALMRSPTGLPVELVEYPWPASPSPFFFEPILSVETPKGAPPSGIVLEELATLETIFDFKITGQLTSTRFPLPFWTTHIPGRIGIVGLIQKVTHLETALKFWKECLGFKTAVIKSDTHSCGQVDLQSPLKSWALKIAIFGDKSLDPRSVKMDEDGITCLSFVSSSLNRDRIPFIKFPPFPTTQPFNIEINKRALNLEIFDTQMGFFIELMEVGNVGK